MVILRHGMGNLVRRITFPKAGRTSFPFSADPTGKRLFLLDLPHGRADDHPHAFPRQGFVTQSGVLHRLFYGIQAVAGGLSIPVYRQIPRPIIISYLRADFDAILRVIRKRRNRPINGAGPAKSVPKRLKGPSRRG